MMEHACIKELIDLIRDIDRLTKAEVKILGHILSFVSYEPYVKIVQLRGDIMLSNERIISEQFLNGIQRIVNCIRSEHGHQIGIRVYPYRGTIVINLVEESGTSSVEIRNGVTTALVPGYYITIEPNQEILETIFNDGKYEGYIKAAKMLVAKCRIINEYLQLPNDYKSYICGLNVGIKEAVFVFWRKAFIGKNVELVPLHPLILLAIKYNKNKKVK